MNIGIVKEYQHLEHRVALTPGGVQTLVKEGHSVYIESKAGDESKFSDENYREVGGEIVYSRSEVYGRSEMILSVTEISPEDYEHLVDNHIILSFHHMAVQPRSSIEVIQEKKITVIGFEIIEEDDGLLPVLLSMSQIAGAMSVLAASEYLQNEKKGKGMLLGGIPGVPPAAVVVLGAGIVGQSAIQAAIGLGAQVTVLDTNLRKLQTVKNHFHGTVITTYANDYNVARAVAYADVLIGAVLIHGERTPNVVSREMVATMRPKSVIVDVSIDQGGCIETSRPTDFSAPVYEEEGVIHFCVSNIASNVSRTATHALTNAALPYIKQIANGGLEVLRESRDLSRGVYFCEGSCVNKAISELFDIKLDFINDVIQKNK